MIEGQFFSFFLVLMTAVIFSTVFTRLHVSWTISLIVGGIVIGPHALDIFTPNDTLLFMSEIGIVFLMFMAGLEVRVQNVKEEFKDISLISILNGLIPFAVGFLIGKVFGFSYSVSILLGITFISSSIAVVVPSLVSHKVLGSKIGNIILGSTMIQDVASLVLLSIFFQSTENITTLPLPVFYIFLIITLIILRKVIPFIKWWFKTEGAFNQEFRAIIFSLIGTVVIFQILGLHPIIAGFFVGFVLADAVKSEVMKEKLRAIGYGLFIPVFFIIVGTQTDLSVFTALGPTLGLALAIVIGSVLSKYFSGYFSSRISGLSKEDSDLVAVTSIPQLSTTLAVIFAASTLGVAPPEIVTSLVALTIVTTMLSPILVNRSIQRREKKFEAVTKI